MHLTDYKFKRITRTVGRGRLAAETIVEVTFYEGDIVAVPDDVDSEPFSPPNPAPQPRYKRSAKRGKTLVIVYAGTLSDEQLVRAMNRQLHDDRDGRTTIPKQTPTEAEKLGPPRPQKSSREMDTR